MADVVLRSWRRFKRTRCNQASPCQERTCRQCPGSLEGPAECPDTQFQQDLGLRGVCAKRATVIPLLRFSGSNAPTRRSTKPRLALPWVLPDVQLSPLSCALGRSCLPVATRRKRRQSRTHLVGPAECPAPVRSRPRSCRHSPGSWGVRGVPWRADPTGPRPPWALLGVLLSTASLENLGVNGMLPHVEHLGG